MLELFKSILPYITPIFVVSTMLNVGLMQKASEIVEHLKYFLFVSKMLLANFVLAPL